MFSDGRFGTLLFNTTKKHVKVDSYEQTEEVERALTAALGAGTAVTTWGSEQTTNSGFTFVLKTVQEFNAFVEVAKKRRV